LFNLFLENSAIAISLLVGEYLENKALSRIIDSKQYTTNEEIQEKIDKLQKRNEVLTKQVETITSSESDASLYNSMICILNKENVYLTSSLEGRHVLRKLIKKGNQLSHLITRLVQSIPPKFHNTLLHLCEGDLYRQKYRASAPSSLLTSPSSSAIGSNSHQNNSTHVTGVSNINFSSNNVTADMGGSSRWLPPNFSQSTDVTPHQTKLITLIGRIRMMQVMLEKISKQLGVLVISDDSSMRYHYLRQVLILACLCNHLTHDAVFFNNPYYYECFNNFCQLGKSIIELLVIILPDGETNNTNVNSSPYLRSSSSLSTITNLLNPATTVRDVVTNINSFNNFDANNNNNIFKHKLNTGCQQQNYEHVRYLLGLFIAQVSFTSTKIIPAQFFAPGLFDLSV
jgi:hypothetical protein